MKRSLALGALMAFVITGSAWAEEPYIDKIDGRMTYKNCISTVKSTGGVQAKLSQRYETLPNPIVSSDFINNKNEYIATETNIFGSKQVERGKGGAIYWSDVDLTIKNSTFQNNSANEKAGAIDVNQNAVVTLENNEFINNSAKYWGGAIELQKATAVLKFIGNNNFEGNSTQFGGAIVANNGKVNLGVENNTIPTKTTFKENKAYGINQYGGGAILLTGSNSELNVYSYVEFDGNSTSYNGGAISNSGTIKFITGTAIFKENKADGDGGAIYNSGTIDFDGGTVEFDSNGVTKSGKNGGAIFNKNKLNFKSGIVTFFNNKADGKLNDIYNYGTINIEEKATVKILSGMDSYRSTSSNDINRYGITNIKGGMLELGGITNITNLGGDGGTIKFVDTDAYLTVVNNTNQKLKFEANGVVNDYLDNNVDKINEFISAIDYAADTTLTMEAGDIVGEVTAKLVEYKTDDNEDPRKGKLVVDEETKPVEKANTKNQAISDASIAMKLHWRSHINDMNKRMGELRDANGEHGVWTRMVRGESEYKNTKAQYNQYQLGYDEKLSVDKRWTVGAAVTFSEGDAGYGYGSTEDKSTAFAIYGSKLNNDGTFVDLIARYAHLESDVDDQAGKGSYSANGMSVSAEFGKRIQQGNGLWIEPQAELTYGTVDGAEYKLGTKIVEVGDMDSLIGRVGFRIGKDIEKGNVYARASYLYDFEGETENAFRNDTARRSFNEDLGGGWWEVGLGANINLSKATYVYADVEKTFGGEVDTNWQWNLGVRYSF